MSILKRMKLDTVYVVKESNDETLIVGDLIWLSSLWPKILHCVQARGFLDENDCKDICDVALTGVDGWTVVTDQWGSNVCRI